MPSDCIPVAENFERKDFTLSEAVAIKRALEPELKAAAKERQAEGGKSKSEASGKLPTASKGRARDKAAALTGVKRRTLEKAEAIIDAAEKEPEKIGIGRSRAYEYIALADGRKSLEQIRHQSAETSKKHRQVNGRPSRDGQGSSLAVRAQESSCIT